MSALAFVKKQSIQFYFTDRDGALVCQVPPTAVTDLEVVSEDALKDALVKSLGTTPAHPTVPTILVLSDELIFSLKIDPKTEAEQLKNFIADIPFNAVGQTKLHIATTELVIATNEDLYGTIVQARHQNSPPPHGSAF